MINRYSRIGIIIIMMFSLVISESAIAYAADSNLIIETIAGTGIGSNTGDGGDATLAGIHFPSKVAVDSLGQVYITSYFGNSVRKIDTNGKISTIAGTGGYGSTGDGGSATKAELMGPTGVAVDSNGNVYISEFAGNRVRKIDTTGIITTIAGNGVRRSTGDGGFASKALVNRPMSVKVDKSDNIYIVEFAGNRIRKIDASGKISTIAGTGTSGYTGDGGLATKARINSPQDIAIDESGNLYIADAGNRRVRKIDSSGIISTVGGTGAYGYSGDGGLATEAELAYLRGVGVDQLGNIYLAQDMLACIRKIDSSGIISTVEGTETGLSSPYGLTVDQSGNVYFADRARNLVMRILVPVIEPEQTTSSSNHKMRPLNVEKTSFGRTVASLEKGGLGLLKEIEAETGLVDYRLLLRAQSKDYRLRIPYSDFKAKRDEGARNLKLTYRDQKIEIPMELFQCDELLAGLPCQTAATIEIHLHADDEENITRTVQLLVTEERDEKTKVIHRADLLLN